jgi:hypothetical protein
MSGAINEGSGGLRGIETLTLPNTDRGEIEAPFILKRVRIGLGSRAIAIEQYSAARPRHGDIHRLLSVKAE